MENTKKKADHKKRWGVIILILVIALLLLMIGVIVGVAGYFMGNLEVDKSLNKKTPEELGINTSFYEDKKANTDQNITNIALFGLDSRDNDHKGRSDTIMILTVDHDRHKLKLTSIARDTYVPIPGQEEKTKINHAYMYGGPELAIRTINQNFNMNITDYVTVNFGDIEQLVNIIGGVTVNLSEAEKNQMASLVNLPTGNVRLNGKQAVEYCQIRYIDSDNVRTSRQREVLTSMFQTARSMSISQYPALIKEGLNLCVTSLGYTDILGLSKIMLNKDLVLETAAFPNENIQSHGEIINGTWFYLYDLEQASNMLYDFIYNDRGM